MELKFRNLRADEIDCRVAQISEKGLSLLLYKDARVDQRILDEAVGPMNWQRHHLRENANCIVSIWDDEKQQWIEKEDTGTESNTEAEKGLASDSFKRACFNWGIGRELYTAPFIWIGADKCEIKAGKNGKPACYDKFRVSFIRVEDGTITGLIIKSSRGVVFKYGKTDTDPKQEIAAQEESPEEAPAEGVGEQLIDAAKVAAITNTIAKKGLSKNSILQHYKKTAFEEMTITEWMDAMNILAKYKDR